MFNRFFHNGPVLTASISGGLIMSLASGAFTLSMDLPVWLAVLNTVASGTIAASSTYMIGTGMEMGIHKITTGHWTREPTDSSTPINTV